MYKPHLFRAIQCVFGTLSATVIVFLTGCSQTKPDTSLFGTAMHTGTLYVYRTQVPERKPCQKVPEFVSLQGADGLVGYVDDKGRVKPELLVTLDDLITVSLSSAFIKYFQEGSISNNNFPYDVNSSEKGEDKRKGEIALVLSFEAGTAKRESFVAFSSRNQTLGSYLSLKNWPLIGPVKVDGPDLKVRVVMIEMDSEENARANQLFRVSASTLGQVDPVSAPVLKVAEPIVEALIALNGDDVILDQRFTLHRLAKNAKATSVHRTPLLLGDYILVMQEDRLSGTDVDRVARDALNPPAMSSMRLRVDDHMVYRVYDYWTDRWGWKHVAEPDPNPHEAKYKPNGNDKQVECCSTAILIPPPTSELSDPVVNMARRIDLDKVPYLGKCKNGYWPEHPDAGKIRTQVLGYPVDYTTSLERWYCLEHALSTAFCDGLRGKVSRVGLRKNSTKSYDPGCKEAEFHDGDYLPLNYPVSVYPTANVVMARYPLHTHLVLNISRSVGGAGLPVHDRYQDYQAFINDQLETVQDDSAAKKLGDQLTAAILQNRKQAVLLQKVNATEGYEKKLCLLSQGLGACDDKQPLNDAPLFNEIYHLTGEVLTSRAEVTAHIRKACEGKDADSCPCEVTIPPVIENLSKDTRDPDTDYIERVQDALDKAGFAVPCAEKGNFGEETDKQVKAFQKFKGLKENGIIGEKTRKVLGL